MDVILTEGSSPTDDNEHYNATYLYYEQTPQEDSYYAAQDWMSLMVASRWKIVNSFCNYFSLVLCASGIVANVLTIAIHKRLGLKDCGDLLVSSMAVSDVTLLLTYFLDHVTVAVKDFDMTWHNYLVLAYMNLFYPWRYRAWYFSLYLTALLSVERVVATLSLSRASRIFTPKQVIRMLGLLLAIVFIFTVPKLYLYFDYEVWRHKYHMTPSVFLMVAPVATLRNVALVCSVAVVHIPWVTIGLSLIVLCTSVPVLFYKVSRGENCKTDLKNLKQFKLMLLVYTVKCLALIPSALELINETFHLYSRMLLEGINWMPHLLKVSNILFASGSFSVCVTLNSKFAAVFKGLLKPHK